MKDIKIAGLRLPIFIIVFIILIIAVATETLPQNMVGAFFFMLMLGELLNLIGNKLPIVRTYFGGGPIIVIFGGAALVYFHILPESTVETVSNFMKDPGGFLDFYIAALITGSILGMNRKLLLKAALRFIPTILAGVAAALGLVAVIGPLVGVPAGEAIANIGIPIMGGGMGAGAVPISKVFSGVLNIPAGEILSKLVPAVALGNAMAIVAGGLLNQLGKAKPKFTGNGQMLRKGHFNAEIEDEGQPEFKDYMIGIIFSTGFFAVGELLSKFFSRWFNLHPYAFMILMVAICKGTNIIPESIDRSCSYWYQFVSLNFTAALMLGIGVAYTDLGQVIAAFTPQYLILCAVVLVGAILGTGFIGYLVGFNFVEAAITAGLCMANMGGTGDVAVLKASDRMELMPFAQISSRIGGAFIIFLATILVPIFFG